MKAVWKACGKLDGWQRALSLAVRQIGGLWAYRARRSAASSHSE